MSTSTKDSSNQLTAIERALAAARARKAAKVETDEVPPTVVAVPQVRGITAVSKVVSVEKKEEDVARLRAERRAQREVDRATRSAERAKEREARVGRSVGQVGGPVHMKKVETARSKLPKLEDVAAGIFAEATTSLTVAQLEALAVHLQFHNRVAATVAAPREPLSVGVRVRIVGGDPRFIGQVGSVSRSQKLRSHVVIPGRAREVYVFTAHLQVVEEVV